MYEKWNLKKVDTHTHMRNWDAPVHLSTQSETSKKKILTPCEIWDMFSDAGPH